jgi:hypothetical protein
MKTSALALLLLWAPCTAFAAGESGLGAAIDFSRYRVDLAYTGAPVETAAIDEIGLTLSETVTPDFDLALQGGYTDVDPGNHPAAAGFNLTGRFFGVVARYRPKLGPYVSLFAEAAYRHHEADNGRTEDQYDELKWYETEVRLGPAFRAGYFEFVVGGYYQHFDGDEHARGPLTFRRDFEVDSATGAFAGVSYYFDPTARIGLFGESGGRRGLRLLFARRF